jgi:hypothetical protein
MVLSIASGKNCSEEKAHKLYITLECMLMVSKRFPWNAKYETVYRWLASFIVIYTIMNLKG